MKLLRGVLSSLVSPSAAKAPPKEPDLEPVAAPDAGPAGADGPQAMPLPAWQLLGDKTGVLEGEYPDNARPEIRALFDHAPRRILDIGCATGAVGLGLKQTYDAWVWGCEPNVTAAELARPRLDRISIQPTSQWSAQDRELLGTIDTVLLLDVLEHMYNPWAELQFLAQWLPADAQVIVSLPNIGHLGILSDLARGSFRYERQGILDVTHIRFFTHAEMLVLFDQTGFESEHALILTSNPEIELPSFPIQVSTGKLSVMVDNLQEWKMFHAIQVGFRLRRKAAL